jgi:hypothetical protein
MTEAEWTACTDPLLLLRFLRTPWAAWRSKGSNRRRLQLFVCASCRRFWPLLGELGLQTTLEAAERDADGAADFHETQEVAGATWTRVKQLPRSAPGTSVGWAVAWAVCGQGNTGFAEYAVRELLSLTGRWVGIKVLFGRLGFGTLRAEQRYHVRLLHDVFGNPFRPVSFKPAWRTSTVKALAAQMYESREFSAMPILADALQDAGCDNTDILNHCRTEGATHVRGCWVVDLVLSQE